MRTGQVAGTHKKFADDFVADKFEMFFKELHPPSFIERMVRIEPVFERAVFLLYLF